MLLLQGAGRMCRGVRVWFSRTRSWWRSNSGLHYESSMICSSVFAEVEPPIGIRQISNKREKDLPTNRIRGQLFAQHCLQGIYENGLWVSWQKNKNPPTCMCIFFNQDSISNFRRWSVFRIWNAWYWLLTSVASKYSNIIFVVFILIINILFYESGTR